ncbi:uncharacterized protein K452DRAFT_155503 [Aplosporella prunicola CBS 121167]|uniref:Uncharacterized protein n=1 Tax=Aplosporella prunicola CBS 121167 TaxID=1176127 RepID=A0A6A6BJC6_9PEZI|nr:uncharacterized protein K452DRAFT_155503 [Aplosporella prunicola CBS 121167]KAF2144259.1 hypothetical protein K452DRAFT_155503 [Aplosporella prunicola CBS 121167]
MLLERKAKRTRRGKKADKGAGRQSGSGCPIIDLRWCGDQRRLRVMRWKCGERLECCERWARFGDSGVSRLARGSVRVRREAKKGNNYTKRANMWCCLDTTVESLLMATPTCPTSDIPTRAGQASMSGREPTGVMYKGFCVAAKTVDAGMRMSHVVLRHDRLMPLHQATAWKWGFRAVARRRKKPWFHLARPSQSGRVSPGTGSAGGQL